MPEKETTPEKINRLRKEAAEKRARAKAQRNPDMLSRMLDPKGSTEDEEDAESYEAGAKLLEEEANALEKSPITPDTAYDIFPASPDGQTPSGEPPIPSVLDDVKGNEYPWHPGQNASGKPLAVPGFELWNLYMQLPTLLRFGIPVTVLILLFGVWSFLAAPKEPSAPQATNSPADNNASGRNVSGRIWEAREILAYLFQYEVGDKIRFGTRYTLTMARTDGAYVGDGLPFINDGLVTLTWKNSNPCGTFTPNTNGTEVRWEHFACPEHNPNKTRNESKEVHPATITVTITDKITGEVFTRTDTQGSAPTSPGQ